MLITVVVAIFSEIFRVAAAIPILFFFNQNLLFSPPARARRKKARDIRSRSRAFFAPSTGALIPTSTR